MVERQRGGILLVTSGAAWAGGGRLTTYGGTKAFDLVFAEGLWAELRRDGVDVLSLVVGATDTPALRASLEKFGVTVDDLAKMCRSRTRPTWRAKGSPTSATVRRGRWESRTARDRHCWPGCRGVRQWSSSRRATTRCSATDTRRRTIRGMSYQVYASDTDPPPHSCSVGETVIHAPPQPTGVVHAVHAGSDLAMCGLPIDGLYLFPMHVWDTFSAAEGACPTCTTAIAAHDA